MQQPGLHLAGAIPDVVLGEMRTYGDLVDVIEVLGRGEAHG